MDKPPLRVVFVPREVLAPAFGRAVYRERTAYVREDLPPRVKRFTVAHELYHLRDRRRWGGAFGRELRANLVPALRDPLGLLACMWANCNRERIAFYWDRIRRGY